MGDYSIHWNVKWYLNMRVGDREVRDVLHIMLHVLGLVKNLFLVSKASTQGFKVEF